MDVFLECTLLACEAHRDDVRMGNSAPYVTHCLAVMELHHQLFGCNEPDELGADMIHDVEEDHGDRFPLGAIVERVGERAAHGAHWVCKPKRPDGVDKLTHNLNHYRKMVDGKAPQFALQRKICDRLHNLEDPQIWRPNFRRFYLADTYNMVQVFGDVPGIELVRTRLAQIRDHGR